MTKYDGLIECSYRCMYKLLEKLESMPHWSDLTVFNPMLTFFIHDAHGTDVAKCSVPPQTNSCKLADI